MQGNHMKGVLTPQGGLWELSTTKQKKRLGKEHLQRIIDLCKSVEERGIDPFLVEVDDIVDIIHTYFPEWNDPEELCLDAEAVHHIASAIKLQSEWVKHRSTSLYTDPFLIEEKLRKLPSEEIATIFLQSWRPIVELEQLSPQSLTDAVKYWQDLAPMHQRWQKNSMSQMETGTTTFDELLENQIVAEEEFSRALEMFWRELQARGEEKVEYWSFVGAQTYEETVRRAYLTSFLVTYGYATLMVDRLEEIVFIKPYKKPLKTPGKKQAVSLPISVSFDEWKHWREGIKN
jgi:hypothetical protein